MSDWAPILVHVEEDSLCISDQSHTLLVQSILEENNQSYCTSKWDWRWDHGSLREGQNPIAKTFSWAPNNSMCLYQSFISFINCYVISCITAGCLYFTTKPGGNALQLQLCIQKAYQAHAKFRCFWKPSARSLTDPQNPHGCPMWWLHSIASLNCVTELLALTSLQCVRAILPPSL